MIFKNHTRLIENVENEILRQKRSDMLTILTNVITSIDPYQLVSSRFQNNTLKLSDQSFPLNQFDHIFLVGFGKASVGMAQAVCDEIFIHSGAVITHDTDAIVQSDRVQTYYGSHPIPDQGSMRGTEQLLRIINTCSPNDLLLVLISGGGSALLCLPTVPLEDIQTTTSLLLKAGATITELNTVRKHLSNVKGGQLIKSVPCPVVSLILSDVINDPLEFIASGPTYPDSTTFGDALSVFHRYDLWEKVPSSVQKVITKGIKGVIPDTPTADAPCFKHGYHEIIGNNTIACAVAVQYADMLGYQAEIISTSLSGEARDTGPWFLRTARSRTKKDRNIIIGGGETTVTVKGSGEGGRCQEMVLACIEDLAGSESVYACLATDGNDGASPAAGAIADGKSLYRAERLHLDISTYLDCNDSYHFFESLNDTFHTGPTGTNVMDIFIVIP